MIHHYLAPSRAGMKITVAVTGVIPQIGTTVIISNLANFEVPPPVQGAPAGSVYISGAKVCIGQVRKDK
jgi:hypothetical protein